uniref:Suppressor of cytokine signaling 3 n=2 Tax=Podarcis muralis TaxID=64176 RepID=A0A670I3W3_PODMU
MGWPLAACLGRAREEAEFLEPGGGAGGCSIKTSSRGSGGFAIRTSQARKSQRGSRFPCKSLANKPCAAGAPLPAASFLVAPQVRVLASRCIRQQPRSLGKLAPCAMVTHSKFPSAGMSHPLDTSLRLKTFSSKSEYQLVVNAVRKLQESGFYWSAVTGGQANLLLSAEPTGTFLIRDSSDQRHFFTLSVKTESGTKNLRIQCEGGTFSLQSDPHSSQPVPRFDCVLKLVHHYMPLPEQQPGQAPHPKRAYYIYSGGEKIPLVLSRPLSSNVSTLQHLCRKTVNGHLDSYEKMTQLPGPIKEFLDQYDAPF